MVIGITGGSGSGKSYIAQKFVAYNFNIVDADKIAKDIMKTDSSLKEKIAETFGSSLIVDGEVDRKALGKIVFADENKLKTLNKLTHPAILNEIKKQIREHDKVILDAPLLLEAGLDKYCDYTVSVIADTDVRIQRMMDRDGIDYDTAMNRIKRQLSDDEYLDNTDYCILNNGKTYVNAMVKTIVEDIFNTK